MTRMPKYRTKGGANVGVRLPPDLLEKVQHEADQQDIPMSSVMRRALRFYFSVEQPSVKPLYGPFGAEGRHAQAMAAAIAGQREDGTP